MELAGDADIGQPFPEAPLEERHRPLHARPAVRFRLEDDRRRPRESLADLPDDVEVELAADDELHFLGRLREPFLNA